MPSSARLSPGHGLKPGSRFWAGRSVASVAIGILTTAICAMALLAFALSFEGLIRHFVDTDKLLAADFVHRVFVLGRPWSDFQLPRTPSLFPDLLIAAPVQLAASWQVAMLIFAWLMLTILVLTGAFVVHRITDARFWLCVTIMLAVTVPLCLGEQWLSARGEGRHYFTLSLVSHGGAFVMSLVTVALCEVSESMALAARRVAYVGIALLTAAIIVSDKLAVFELSIPAALAVVAFAIPRSHGLKVALSLAAGTAIAMLGERFLVMEPEWPLVFGLIPARIHAALTMTPLSISVGTWLPAAIVLMVGLWSIFRSGAGRRMKFYAVAGSASIALTSALTYAFLYVDATHIRYVQAMMWWPVVALAVPLSFFANRSLMSRRLVAGGLAVVLVGGLLVLSRWHAGALMNWHHPLANCLAQAHQRLDLHQGLALYEHARPLTVASGWRMQVDPVEANGELTFWGSDLKSSSYRLNDPQAPPLYDFILLDQLDRDALVRRFGYPEGEFACGDAQFWVFRHGMNPN